MQIQKLGNRTVRMTICATALACGSLQPAKAADEDSNPDPVTKGESSSSSASISGSVNNGKGVVTYNEKEVWNGKIEQGLRTAARCIGGTGESTGDFAAAWDGEELVWENVPGAGEKLQDMAGAMSRGADLEGRMKAIMAEMAKRPQSPREMQNRIKELMSGADASGNHAQASASISGSTTNGAGVVTYGGEEVWEGKITERLRVKAEASRDKDNYDGEYAAAWDGENMLWENVPGAAKALDATQSKP